MSLYFYYLNDILTNFYFFKLHLIDTLVKAIHELSRGDVTDDTDKFLKRMKRPLPPGSPPTKLFARNFDVDKFNSDSLMDTEGK